jgi:hypothetical protein
MTSKLGKAIKHADAAIGRYEASIDAVVRASENLAAAARKREEMVAAYRAKYGREPRV